MNEWFQIGVGLASLIVAARVLVGGTRRRRARRDKAKERWGRWAPWMPERFDGPMVVLSAASMFVIGTYLLYSGFA